MGRKKSRFYKDAAKVNSDGFSTANGRNEPSGLHPVKVDPLLMRKDGSKKREREFEKYVAKKLKKEERPDLFKRLQEVSFSSEQLQSSKQLSMKDARHGSCTVSRPSEETLVPASGPSSYEQLHGNRPLPIFSCSDKKSFEQQDDGLDDELSASDEEVDQLKPEAVPLSEKTKEHKAAFFVTVTRSPEIEEQRSQLPIYAEEQAIMECIRENPVSIICGETGSGKTTQVPQFLFEAGYGHPDSEHPGMIGVTQPRRVAAISMAARVQEELGGPRTADGALMVAHQVRFDSEVKPGARIKFMTDGILLRELASDFLLQRYSVLILDEAHERNVNTDILLGMLSRVVRLRNEMIAQGREGIWPLRLVIMSATLDVEALRAPRLFSPAPPVLRVEARRHPVTVHFSRRTVPDYLDMAYRTVCKIHANLPPGGILVFLTGKQEIAELARRLSRKYPELLAQDKAPRSKSKEDADFEAAMDEEGDAVEGEMEDPMEAADEAAGSDGEEDWSGSEFELDAETAGPLHVLPLHALLPPSQQQRIFIPAPEGTRLCVLATNLAETSLTIPGIRYVVDSGRVKQRITCPQTGAQQFQVVWASQASAAQRAGRAGRTGPGHCYRLFSAAVFDQRCPPHAPPELLRAPAESLVLRLRAMGIDAPHAFPLPAQPDPSALLGAEQLLRRLGALESVSGRITRLGALMADVPLAPRWARLLLLAGQDQIDGRCSTSTVLITAALCATLAVGDPFVAERDADENPNPEKGRSGLAAFATAPVTSDLLAILSAFITYINMPAQQRQSFCAQHGLLMRRLEETEMQNRQLLALLPQLFLGLKLDQTVLPSTVDRKTRDYLRRLLTESLFDRIAERVRLPAPRPKAPAYKLLSVADTSTETEEALPEGQLPADIFLLHPQSLLARNPPRFLVFTEAISISSDQKQAAPSMRYATAIEQDWVPDELLLTTSNS